VGCAGTRPRGRKSVRALPARRSTEGRRRELGGNPGGLRPRGLRERASQRPQIRCIGRCPRAYLPRAIPALSANFIPGGAGQPNRNERRESSVIRRPWQSKGYFNQKIKVGRIFWPGRSKKSENLCSAGIHQVGRGILKDSGAHRRAIAVIGQILLACGSHRKLACPCLLGLY
jgi:hypothetical protein